MSVYLIACRELGMVKIGVASNPWARMKTLQTSFPVDLTLEGLIQGAYRRERELHAQFADHRARGEWFRICPALEELIAASIKPVKPKSIAQRRRLADLHDEPTDDTAIEAMRAKTMAEYFAKRNPVGDCPVPAALDNCFLSKADRRRIASGDITFPYREIIAATAEMEGSR